MIEKLTNSEILDVAQFCDREKIEEVFQIADNKGGYYFQGKPKGGALQKFTIERKET